MSDPIGSAISASVSRGNFVSNRSLSASRVEAASLLPPPKPAPCGIFFFSSIEIAGLIFVAAKKLFAPRTIRFSSPVGKERSSQLNSIPFSQSVLSISIWSQSEIGAMSDSISFFKVGLQLYTAEGPEIVRAVLSTSAKVWLDLKLYDIPNTVARAVESASNLGVQMLTIHLSGGSEMIRAATAARPNKMLLLGVTVLTSATEQTLREIGIADKVDDQVMR